MLQVFIRFVRTAIVLALFAVLSFSAVASSQEARSLSGKLLQQSGLDGLINQYPEIVKTSLRQKIKGAGVPSVMTEAFNQRIDGAFDQVEIKGLVTKRIAESLSTEDMKSVLDWYGSPIGQKIQAAELSEMTEQEYARLDSQLDQLFMQYSGTDREDLFIAFDSATRATESMLDSAVAVELAMAATLTSVFKGPDLPDFTELRNIVERRRGALRGHIGQQVYLNYLYTYRDLTDSELERYIAFARSELGNRFVEVVNSAVYTVLSERSEMLGKG